MPSFILNLSVARRLALGFSLVLALSIMSIIVAIVRLQAVASHTEEMLGSPLKTERLVSDWYRLIHTGVLRTAAIARSTDSSLASYFAEQTKASSAKSSAFQKELDGLMETKEDKALFAQLIEARKAFIEIRDAIVALKKEGKADEANQVLDQRFTPIGSTYLDKLEALQSLQRSKIDESGKRIAEINDTSRTLLISLGIFSTLLSALLAWMITRHLTKPLAHAKLVAGSISGGDLTANIDVHSTDELGELLANLKHMQDSLVDVVSKVRQGSESVATASAQIAEGNNDLSVRTEQQASALQQTASSMEELSSTVRQNADSARTANQLAVSASEVAVKGGEVMGRVVQTMKGIHESSSRIADIIGVIDGIAFQTNILALNAAVEAARAGEQGRGFAVVASEVRSLAGRSAEAAKEIKTLIGTSVDRVEQGTALVDQAGATMNEVVNSIKRVTDIVGEISSASNEQSIGIGKIGQAVSEMDQSTQQNAAMVEEMAAAASSLKSQAQDLVHVVDAFKIGDQR